MKDQKGPNSLQIIVKLNIRFDQKQFLRKSLKNKTHTYRERILFVCLIIFETGFLCVVLAVLELTL